MLEQSQLWIPTLPGSGEVVLSAHFGGAPLGLARWLPRTGIFSPRTLSVHEFDETPLLFQAHRAWTLIPRYHVVDADERRVGCVQRDALLTPSGVTLVWKLRDDVHTRFHVIGGPLLATESREPGGNRLTFNTGDGLENPFLRMLVLAAVLLG